MCKYKVMLRDSKMEGPRPPTNLTCWVRAFCSRSWRATGNPGAPLSWTGSPGVARWLAGTEGAHWTRQPPDRRYYRMLSVGVCRPPLTAEQPLMLLKERKKKKKRRPRWTSLNTVCVSPSARPCVPQNTKRSNVIHWALKLNLGQLHRN